MRGPEIRRVKDMVKDMRDQLSNMYLRVLVSRDEYEEGSEEYEAIDDVMRCIDEAADCMDNALDYLV